jgi:UDP-N-acetylmuramoyl-L-alanyl-D-glutamate--2,6-diaminopimelate ligase
MARRGRTLGELATMVGGEVRAGPGTPVIDVTHDSRLVQPGWLYVAIRGSRVDGHAFVGDALAAGASAVCVEQTTGHDDVPQLLVADTRAALGPLSAAVHDNPSQTVDVVGVTGTNGKTTVTHYVESIVADSGLRTGLIGTIHSRIGEETLPAGLTTPEASDFQRLLARMRDEGVSLVAVEVSSHALELGRVRGTRFAVAAFTNISQDHLDFHGDMSSYRAAKQSLFADYEVGTAVVNVDDPVGVDIAAGFAGTLLKVGEKGDIRVSRLERLSTGTRFSLGTPWGSTEVTAPVVGDFNVANLAMAAACALAVGVSFDEVVGNMARVRGVPGRFEIVSGDDQIVVVVDYAHTPEGVARVVAAGREMTAGRVIGLIGAGGDRDRRKRPAMGAAISGADLSFITSDNPRSEDPADIVAAVASGLVPGADHVIEVDRRTAIAQAIDAANDGDVVLILGRGHETHQQVGDERLEFDDRLVAAECLARRRSSADLGGASGRMLS